MGSTACDGDQPCISFLLRSDQNGLALTLAASCAASFCHVVGSEPGAGAGAVSGPSSPPSDTRAGFLVGPAATLVVGEAVAGGGWAAVGGSAVGLRLGG